MNQRLLLIAALVCLASCSQPQAAAPEAQFALKDMGSFHIGGRDVVVTGKKPPAGVQLTPGVAPNIDPNGTYRVEQMYVQYFIPANQRGKLPLLLWHGAWLTGATYETKPDGNPGWLQYFLKRGWPVYNSDAVERGRAGWAPFPGIFKAEPIWLTRENAFERFRIGDGKGSYNADPAKRRWAEGAQFPKESYDQFVSQAVPRWTTNNQATIDAYVQLVDKVCPCAVMVHSQSGLFGAVVAELRPDKVKALIMVEPANGGPSPASLKNTPILNIWGDFLDDRWSQIRGVVNKYYDEVRAAGGTVDVIDLPKTGIKGNSHMIMMDRNSDQVAELIQKWLEGKGLYQ